MSEKENPDNVFQTQSKQKLNKLSEQAGYEIPVTDVTLPSKGKIYSLDHPLCNEESVEIKCLTAKEEDIMTSPALIKNGTVLTRMLHSVLLNKMVDPDSLLVGDKNALLIAARITGYGANYTVELECPACKEKYKEEFSLNGLKIKPLGAEPLQENMNLFDFVLPISGHKVNFKLLTSADEAEISKVNERLKKATGKQSDSTVTLRLKYSVVSINGEQDRSKINSMVENMIAGDARALRKYINQISPNIDMKKWTTCKSCSEESEVEVPLGVSFFWPDLDE